jgi:hypothetical protein
MVDLLDLQQVQRCQHLLQEITLLAESQVSRDKFLEISAGDLHLDYDNVEELIITFAMILPEVESQLLDYVLSLT